MTKDFYWILAIIFLGLLSVIDTMLTWEAVTSGAAEELNPLMDMMIKMGPWHFFVSKLSLTFAGMVLFYSMRRHMWTKFAIVFCCLVYTIVTGIHLQFAL